MKECNPPSQNDSDRDDTGAPGSRESCLKPSKTANLATQVDLDLIFAWRCSMSNIDIFLIACLHKETMDSYEVDKNDDNIIAHFAL